MSAANSIHIFRQTNDEHTQNKDEPWNYGSTGTRRDKTDTGGKEDGTRVGGGHLYTHDTHGVFTPKACGGEVYHAGENWRAS